MESSIVHHAFPPLFNSTSRILILGTFPSPISREKNEYYGNIRNQFWKIVLEMNNVTMKEADYDFKKEILLSSGIALWDVINACEADNALDSSIRSPIFNIGLPDFIRNNNIEKVYFNGNNAYSLYKRYIGPTDKNVLPSTSPTYASMRYEEKLRIWQEALKKW